MIGVKVRHTFNDTGFFAQGWLGLGGMGIGSDSFYDAAINLGYRWNPSISTTVGYRQYDVDYDDNGFIYDTKTMVGYWASLGHFKVCPFCRGCNKKPHSI